MPTSYYPLHALNVPPDICLPATTQAIINLVSQYVVGQFPVGFTQIVKSDTTPIPADQDKIWLKVDSGGFPIGFFLFSGGDWEAIAPSELYFASDTGSANSVAITVPNYPHTALDNGLFVVKMNAANTGGAATMTVNAFAAVPIKIGGVDPYAKALLEDHYYAFVYTGTSFEPLGPTPPVQSPAKAAVYIYEAPSGTAPVTIPSGNTTVPLNITLPNSANFGTLSGNAVALGEGTYVITGTVQLVDTAGPPAGMLQFAIKNAAAYINWQDLQINNVDDTSLVTVSAVWVVPAGGSASISLELSLSSASDLKYGVDVSSARSERIASLTILKLA